MPCVAYTSQDFRPATMRAIHQANAIIATYLAQGYKLTLRQLYYQFVARDLIPNTQKDYKRLGSIINDGRLAGLIDWEAIEDRTRNLESLAHWSSPSDIMGAVAMQYRTDRWENQPHRVEVWIEKEALAGVFERICQELDVPYLSCRGYTSQSEMWAASQRLIEYEEAGQEVVILHFGDHDPSGIDMTRDIRDRLALFGCGADVRRLALNMDQVHAYDPPPNPAKLTDSRIASYIRAHGRQSWELDALEPQVMAALVRDAITELIDLERWDDDTAAMEEEKGNLHAIATRWVDVVKYLGNGNHA
jgi:hypothetical protein